MTFKLSVEAQEDIIAIAVQSVTVETSDWLEKVIWVSPRARWAPRARWVSDQAEMGGKFP